VFKVPTPVEQQRFRVDNLMKNVNDVIEQQDLGQYKDSVPDYVRNVPALIQTVTSAEIDGYRSNSRREKERVRALEREQSIVIDIDSDSSGTGVC
jgi:hypothetical protein